MANGKLAYYFPHDYHARNDEKIESLLLDHGWEAYGVYWMLIERMYESASCSIRHDKIKQIAQASAISDEKLESIIASCIDEDLFATDGESFWSESARSRRDNIVAFREMTATRARRAAEARWGGRQEKPKPEPIPVELPDKAKEIRKGQAAQNKIVKDVFVYFCEQTGRALKLTDPRRNIIKKRADEGRTWEEFVKVIDNFTRDDWDGRDEYVDIAYCMGTIKGVDKFEHWLHKQAKGGGIMGAG